MIKQLLIVMRALTSAGAAFSQSVNAEKAQAIRELTAIMTAENNVEDLARAFTTQMDGLRIDVVRSTLLQRDELMAEEREEIARNANELKPRTVKRTGQKPR